MAGLRERKKARTRADIQRQALRLFREQGYDATTVDQIVEAAEVSQATFFRHFPTKEDVILANAYDDRVITLFLAQPADRTPAQALRAAIREVVEQMTPQELEEYETRQALILGAPSLRAAAAWKAISVTMPLIARAVAERAGRERDDLAVEAIAGALTGVTIAGTFHMVRHPEDDPTEWIERALELLERGLPL